jgi:hypothetical protein
MGLAVTYSDSLHPFITFLVLVGLNTKSKTKKIPD